MYDGRFVVYNIQPKQLHLFASRLHNLSRCETYLTMTYVPIAARAKDHTQHLISLYFIDHFRTPVRSPHYETRPQLRPSGLKID